MPKMLRIALEIQSGIRRDVYGQKEIANAGKILRALRDTFGEETACEWVRRTFTLFQQEEILFCGLCEQGTCKREAKTTAIYGEKWQTTCKKYSAGCPMQYLWEERENMGASQGRESSEQLTRQLSEVVHELSQETAPTTVFMCCVWEAFQSEKFMQQSLSTITESGEEREGAAADAERGIGKTVAPTLTAYNLDSRSPQSEEQQRIVGAVLKADVERSVGKTSYCIDHVVTTGGDAYSDMLVTPYAHSSFAQYKEGFGQLRASGGDLGGGSETLIEQHYSVRRLTPLECERLQGYPDGWTDIPGQTEATKEELEFWREVWFTWDKLQTEEPEKVKPRTDKRLLKWIKNPVSDSAQYKALGNSVAVPCPEYVLEGISEVLDNRGGHSSP